MINEDDIDDDNEINHDETMKKNGRWFSDKKCKQAMIVNETNISCWILPNAEFCQVPKFSPPSTLDFSYRIFSVYQKIQRLYIWL